MKKQRSNFTGKTVPLALLLLTILSTVALAQEVDHVYLKSGSVILGKILEIEPVDHVKVQDMCGNIWYYQIADVDKITKEPFESAKSTFSEPIGFDAGFVNMTTMGFLVGSSNNQQRAPLSLLMVNGYRTPKGLFGGVGTGIEFLSSNYLPLFIDLRADLLGTDVVPYVMIRGGYSLPLASNHSEYNTTFEYSGGFLFGAGIGLKIRTRDHLAWDVELLYRYQETSYTEKYDYNNQEYEYSDIFNRIEIRLGFYID